MRLVLALAMGLLATGCKPRRVAERELPAPPPIPSLPEVLGPGNREIHPAGPPIDVRALKLPKGVDSAKLQRDLDMIWRVRNALPPDVTGSAMLKTLTESDGPPLDVEKVDLGFGFQRSFVRLAGGYTDCEITMAAYDQALIAARVACEPTATSRELVERALGSAFVSPPEATSFEMRVDYEFPRAGARARAALDRELGGLAPVRKESHQYRRLMSPLDSLAVGDPCWGGLYDKVGPEELSGIFAPYRDYDLVRNVLRGPNPEARIVAARALVQFGAALPADLDAIDKLAKQSIEVTMRRDCDDGYERDTTVNALRHVRAY